MTRSGLTTLLMAALLAAVPGADRVRAQGVSGIAGRWILSRELSEFPRELGFGMDLVPGGGSGQSSGGRPDGAGLAGAGVGPFASGRESPDDVKRMHQLTGEVRTPSTHLTISETASAVTIVNDRGHSRTVHPGARGDVLQLDDVPVAAIARWEAGRLVVLYKVEEGRELRYTFSATADPPQLLVDVKFVERGDGDAVRRVYRPAGANELMTTVLPPPPSASAPAPPVTAAPPRAASDTVPPSPGGPTPGQTAAPASAERTPPPVVPQQPDAELRGLTRLGVVVEGLGAESAACGLKQPVIEAAVGKKLSDAGLTVLRNSDEDTYVYVNVNTARLSNGFCVSRYDTFLYSHTMAKLSYQSTAVLVQVSLLHDGGIAGGDPAAHTKGVLEGVTQYVEQMARRIGSASK